MCLHIYIYYLYTMKNKSAGPFRGHQAAKMEFHLHPVSYVTVYSCISFCKLCCILYSALYPVCCILFPVSIKLVTGYWSRARNPAHHHHRGLLPQLWALSLNASKFIRIPIEFSSCFGCLLASTWAPTWLPKPSKIGPKLLSS